MSHLLEYREFLKRKCTVADEAGFAVSLDEINPWLKPHQASSVQWAVRGGRRAIFARFGLGKTVMQLETLRLIVKHSGGGRALIVAPLGVRQEFRRDAETLGIDLRFVRSIHECDVSGSVECGACYGTGNFYGNDEDGDYLSCDECGGTGKVEKPVIYLTNYETVRDGKLDPINFIATSLDEAAVLRGFGGTKTFREFMRLFESVPYRFVATATPDPNEYIELLAYAAYLGIMDVGQAKTRFFKRDSTKADKLTLHAHKELEFWLWVASWALFIQRPSDLGFSDDGYQLPPMEVIYHEVAVDHHDAGCERDGQEKMFRDATLGVVDAAREKRDTLPQRISRMQEILAAEPDEHHLIWHDLEAERHAIDAAVPGVVSVYGSQDLDEREQAIIDFSDGKIKDLGAKPVIAGSGCNFQRHCRSEIFLGIGFKFNDFIQAIHRCYRFLQPRPVRVHIIYAESERKVLRILQEKWERYNVKAEKMSQIIREYGLSHAAMIKALTRSLGVERIEVTGQNYRLIQNDCVEETSRMESNSVGLILTSIPFATQYEYTPSYNDFGHTEDNGHFFRQMGYLTPELLRVLQPGRIAAIHVKDRIVPGGMTGLGFQTVYPFHCQTIEHFTRHGFAYMGMKTIVTDVVRENNQTYRLGWTEQCKDGTKMGVGMPEYLLLFRKPPSDTTNSYADLPVVKDKKRYSRSRWQIDAHGFERSSGDRLLRPEELLELDHAAIFKLFRQYSLTHVYDFEHHVTLGETLETCQECGHIHTAQGGACDCKCTKAGGILPVTFMLLQPPSVHPDVWTDITRMLTLNGAQSAKGKEMHLCPMQFDLADRVIYQMSMAGETVFDPFSGLGTVPYRAVMLGRRGVGVELNPRYFLDACSYLKAAEQEMAMPSLFDTLPAADSNSQAVSA